MFFHQRAIHDGVDNQLSNCLKSSLLVFKVFSVESYGTHTQGLCWWTKRPTQKPNLSFKPPAPTFPWSKESSSDNSASEISQLSILLSNFYYHCSGFCHHHLSPGSATLLLNGFPWSPPRTLPKISRHFISLLISEFYCGDLIKPLTFRFCPSLALANGTLQPCLLYVKDL